MRIGDRLLDRQRGTFGPCSVEVFLPHRISQSRHRLHIVRTVNREADRADLLSDSLGGAEESCRRMVGAGVAGQAGKAFEHVGEIQVCPALGRARERLMRVAFGFFPLALGDRDPGASRQRHRQMMAGH
ncbi:Uncharacterised protein [Mycobacterium tuberculosis]|nr:Uncharacterised protein [Mycobacterium tuberculosis]CNN54965.1 Uncharacterised protein [Mycobacterium tuberculosis]CNU76215.1 Uncharacterised protein [Mycobacterium tuberculosis]SGO54556.1 Uncharacterised protein [Mycobacterium tuberculosis]